MPKFRLRFRKQQTSTPRSEDDSYSVTPSIQSLPPEFSPTTRTASPSMAKPTEQTQLESVASSSRQVRFADAPISTTIAPLVGEQIQQEQHQEQQESREYLPEQQQQLNRRQQLQQLQQQLKQQGKSTKRIVKSTIKTIGNHTSTIASLPRSIPFKIRNSAAVPVKITKAAVSQLEHLAQKKGTNAAHEVFKVVPSYAYPNTKLNRDELREEMNKPSSYYHSCGRGPSPSPSLSTSGSRSSSPSSRSHSRHSTSRTRNSTISSSRSSTASSTNTSLPQNNSPKIIGYVWLEVLQCFGIPQTEVLKETSAFVIAVCESNGFKTDVMPPVANPMWLSKMRRACRFTIHHAFSSLMIGVFGHNAKSTARDTFIGRIELDLSRLRPKSTYDVTLPLRTYKQIYSRQQRGAIRIRTRLEYIAGERDAIMSYLRYVPNFRQPHEDVTVACCDTKAFQNVARVVHGSSMPGKFSMKLVKATVKEISFLNIHIMRYVRKRELKHLKEWRFPLISGFVFVAWMSSVYWGTLKYVPGHIVVVILLYMWRNYALYVIDGKHDSGFSAPTIEEMALGLAFGTEHKKNDVDYIAPLEMERKDPGGVMCATQLFMNDDDEEDEDEDEDEDGDGDGDREGEGDAMTIDLLPSGDISNDISSSSTAKIKKHRESASLSLQSFSSVAANQNSSRNNNSSNNNKPPSLHEIGEAMKEGVTRTEKPAYSRLQSKVFVGKDGVDFLVANGYAATRLKAVKLGVLLQNELKLFEHVKRKHEFKDGDLDYVFLDVDTFDYEFKTHKPWFKRWFRLIGFEGETISDNEAHWEFPFASGFDHPRLSIKESLVIRSKESKNRMMKEEKKEDVNDLGVTSYKKHLTRKQMKHITGVTSIDHLRGKKRDSMDSMTSNMRMNSGIDLEVELNNEDQTYNLLEDNPEVELKALPPPPNQNIFFVRQKNKQDEKIENVLIREKHKMHGNLGHLFHDKAYKLCVFDRLARKSGSPRVIKTNQSESALPPIEERLQSGALSSSRSKGLATRGEDDANMLMTIRKDEYDRLLSLAQYSNSNVIVSKVAVILQPILEIIQMFLSLIRALFNTMTWRDPFFSFWVMIFGMVLVFFLYVIPWRPLFGILGIFFVGPQNYVFRVLRERKEGRQIENFDVLVRKKRPNKHAALDTDITYFSSHTPDNRPIRQFDIDTSDVKHVAVPVTQINYRRFYDWPPEPEYARVWKSETPTSNPIAAAMLEDGGLTPFSSSSERHKKTKWFKRSNTPIRRRNTQPGFDARTI